MSVEENLLVAERSTERHGWNLERVYNMFPRLRERRDQRAKTLSGGEQQMLAIGRGLMTNPDCLIMDEPSEGLAPIIIQGVWEAIGKLKKEGLSILLVEQNASLALKLVDYVHVMSKGQVVYSARPEELWANDEIKHSYLVFEVWHLTACGKLAIISGDGERAGVIPCGSERLNKIPGQQGT